MSRSMLCLAGDIRGKGLIVMVSTLEAILYEQKAFNGDILVNAVYECKKLLSHYCLYAVRS